MRKLLGCLSFLLPLFGTAAADIETLPLHRTRAYSCAPYKNIVIFSAPRTGSSLIYNIFRFLFEEEDRLLSPHNSFDPTRKVLKTHRFEELNLLQDSNTLYIYTYRNPITASLSNFRIAMRKITSLQEFARDLMEKHAKYLLHSEKAEKEGKSVRRLQYEQFSDDFEIAFALIEDLFPISITPQDRETIKTGYSRESVLSEINDLQSFKEFLPLSGFHGMHIESTGHYTPPQEFVDFLKIYYQEHEEVFNRYQTNREIL